jgi:Eukaryotic cytochrome b561
MLSLFVWSQQRPKVKNYELLVAAFAIFALAGGYIAGIQPINQWRFFSWHPFLMTTGMVGLAGIGAITKKLGGYTNTKVQTNLLAKTELHTYHLLSPHLSFVVFQLHAIIGWLAIFTSAGGIYCIYRNKEINGYHHLKSTHSWCGVGVAISFVSMGLAGSIFLHPDFGIDKTNTLIRTAHKWASRATIALAWITALAGLLQLGAKPWVLVLYALPLLALAPLSLI